MATEDLEGLRRDLEYLDGVVKSQMLAMRLLLRANPALQDRLSAFLAHAQEHGFGADISLEQQKAIVNGNLKLTQLPSASATEY